jgi:Putative  PD-(D/E)XK family member, (DUF4420)
MIKVKEIFESLKKDSPTGVDELDRKLAVRFINSSATVPLFLGLNQKNGVRYLFIHLKEKLTTEVMNKFPVWKGMQIEQKRISIPLASYYDQWFLVLNHHSEYDHEIFEAIIESLCNDLLSLEEYEKMNTELQRYLERWRFFFSIHGKEGITLELQQGLYGELWVLRELIQYNPGFNIVDSWIGPNNESNDFLHEGISLEIKTVTSKKPYNVYINNEKQLDDRELDALYLIAVFLRKIDSGETLPEIIGDIRHLLRNDLFSLQSFEGKLFQVGYLDAQSDLYNTGYVFQKIKSYKINEGFPRILSEEVRDGVGDIKYSIQLAACVAFEKEFKDILRSFLKNEESMQ